MDNRTVKVRSASKIIIEALINRFVNKTKIELFSFVKNLLISCQYI